MMVSGCGFLVSFRTSVLVCVRSCEGVWHVTVHGGYVLSCSAVCSSLCFYEVAVWSCCRGR